MSKSALEIRLNYNQAVKQAETLSEIATDMRNIANKELQDCVSQISNNWTGSNATAYKAKCDTLKSNILITADKLDKTASTIRSIAKNTYNAEMTALRAAEIRTY